MLQHNRTIRFTLNGQATVLETVAERRVIDLLREDLGLTGSKEGCGTGECGACTILVDGLPKLACLMLAAQLEGRQVETVEALQQTDEGRTLMAAFAEEGAVQCGYCIPGMEMASLALLRQGEPLSREQIKEGLSGNLCRCTGYVRIVDAVEKAARVKGEG
ncbi:(2Fe-2S)-binding protein [Trichlorobacter lovleyi]|uniref:(2Fe-2S)-binding domain protein n=1 Tax=Trichlorobacter lovleyi (strain ATCC BAA-1151 / DSM 17278 / SZ) TaxID=398767 RepID=B3E5E3_TRIL1|nr:(2Fe-2S)-binding protein [Trichlorobacter lovleyi]ACD96130.1 (2Fe-2S)-binding domain protein [Trichlorobacter lovleyi SZ]